MKSVMITWSVYLKSALSALHRDTRTKTVLFIALILHLGVGLWSISQVFAHLSQWQAAGSEVLTAHLWLLLFGTWMGIAFFALTSTMSLGFGGDQPRLLMTLPILPAARFRTLYGLQFVEGIGNWLLLAVVVIGIPLIFVLGWQAFLWLLLLLLGEAIAVWMSVVAILLILRYVLPQLKKALLIVLVMCFGIGCVFIAFRLAGFTSRLSLPPTPAPVFINALLLLLLTLVVGPFAGITGKLYEAAFHEMEGRSRSRKVINLPGIRFLNNLLKRHRNLTSALLVKGVLNQTRNVFTWGRVVILLVCTGLNPLIQTFLSPLGFSKMQLAVVYACGVSILAVIDYVPYAVSSEGSRLIYYLVSTASFKIYLRSRLVVHLIAALLVGLTISLVISWWIGLSIQELAQTAIIVGLIVTSYTSFCVWGSVWDEDLNLVSEGMMPVISQEELPFTPRRLQLLGLSFLLLCAMFSLVWKLPVYLSIPALILLEVMVLLSGWRFCNAQIRGLLNRG